MNWIATIAALALAAGCGGPKRSTLGPVLEIDATAPTAHSGKSVSLLEDPSEFVRQGRARCAGGDSKMCAMVGQYAMLAHAAPRPGEDRAAALALAESLLTKECANNAYPACIDRLAAMKLRNAPQAELSAAAEQALVLTKEACARRDPGACELLADWADQAGDSATATEAHVAACAQVLSKGRDVEGDSNCEAAAKAVGGMEVVRARAAELNAAAPPEPKLPDIIDRLGLYDLVPAKKLNAVRVSGVTQIQPPNGEMIAWKKSKLGAATSRVKLCLSDAGKVTTLSFARVSHLPHWNRSIFEHMHEWRYKPFTVNDKPVAVCSFVVFRMRRPVPSGPAMVQ